MNVRVLGQPSIAFFVRAIIVHNYVQFLLRGSFYYDLIHKLQELFTPLELRDRRLNLSGCDFQGGEEVECAMALIGAFEAANNLAIVRFHITSLALQSLNAGLL